MNTIQPLNLKFNNGGLMNSPSITPPINPMQNNPQIDNGGGDDDIYNKPNSGATKFLIDLTQDNTHTRNQFYKIHSDSGGGCLAGAKTCNRDFVYPELKQYGVNNIRDILDNKINIDDYAIKDTKHSDRPKDWVKNKGLDAWEVHDALRGSGYGINPFEGRKFTYAKGNNLPQELTIDDYRKLPIGTIIGQGSAATANFGAGYISKDEDDGRDIPRNRHAVSIVGYDKEDGMPLIFDGGKLTRLDKSKYGQSSVGNFTEFTIPKGYEKFDYYWVKGNSDRVQAYLDNRKPVDLKSDWQPIKEIEEGLNSELVSKINLKNNVSESAFEKISSLMPGLGWKESKLNSNDGFSDIIFSENKLSNEVLKPLVKKLEVFKKNYDPLTVATRSVKQYFKKDIMPKSEFNKYSTQSWKRNIQALEEAGGDREKADEILNRYNQVKDSYIVPNKPTEEALVSSKGPFKVKHLSSFLKSNGITEPELYGSKKSNTVNKKYTELELGAIAAYETIIDKYNKAKKRFPKLNEDELIQLAFATYSNSTKLSEDYVKYYVKGNEIDDNFNAIKNYTYNEERVVDGKKYEAYEDYIKAKKEYERNNNQ